MVIDGIYIYTSLKEAVWADGIDIVSSNDAIASFDGFNDPIDLTENPVNGFLYVSQYDRAGGQGLHGR